MGGRLRRKLGARRGAATEAVGLRVGSGPRTGCGKRRWEHTKAERKGSPGDAPQGQVHSRTGRSLGWGPGRPPLLEAGSRNGLVSTHGL